MDEDLYAEYLKEKGGGTATAAPEGDLYSEYLKEKGPKLSDFGLEPDNNPPPKKRGNYHSPIPSAIVAQPDVTETRKTVGGLGTHRPGEDPNLLNALTETALQMATHPVETATGLVETPYKAGEALRRYTRGEGSGRDALFGALQTAALAGAGPAESLLEKPAAALLGEGLGRAAATTAVGSAAGATFTPDRPSIGAILGALGGAAQLPDAVRNAGDVSEGAIEAGVRSLTPSGPPVDQPAPLTPEQQLLRRRLATEGIAPTGAIARRPAEVIPEPPPEAETYSTKGAVGRRPAATPLQEEYEAEQQQAPADYDYSSTQVNLPTDAAEGIKNLAAAIPDEHLAESGREDNPHITVKYGLHGNDPEPVRAALADEPPITVKLGRTSYFPADEAAVQRGGADVSDVLKVDVDSPDLHRLNQKISDALPHTDTHPEYVPHATVAYLKPGLGEKYEGNGALEGREVTLDHVTFSGKDGNTVDIPLGGGESDAVSWPPVPGKADITPVASANGEFLTRPGIMRDVNRGVQPEALSSPLRLPEPTPADLAVVQPKGVKEIAPEVVAARKAEQAPAPVVTASPKVSEPATVDENGLFFDHRTPSGALRDVRRVSTDGLIKAQREIQEKITQDQQAAIYRNVEADVSGTQYGVHINVGTRTARGTTYQAEALQRLKNYATVMGRIDKELSARGLTQSDIYDRVQEQEQLEAAIEQEAIHHADTEAEVDDAFNFDDLGEEPSKDGATSPRGKTPKEPPASDVLNVAKLNLGSQTAEQRMAAKLEEFRAQRDANKQTFDEADVNRDQILNELRAGDPLALPTAKAKALSGEELLARRDLVRENDRTIQELSRQMDAGVLPPESYRQAAELVEKAVAHNDALLSDLVTGSSQKGRDLNLLRRLANDSTDPAVWRIQAKRMLGDKPLTAEIDAAIRKLASDAEEACK